MVSKSIRAAGEVKTVGQRWLKRAFMGDAYAAPNRRSFMVPRAFEKTPSEYFEIRPRVRHAPACKDARVSRGRILNIQ